MPARREELRLRLQALGFDAVRFARACPAPVGGLQAWLAAGRQAGMAWMERTACKRADPQLVLPGARSVIVLGVGYWGEAGDSSTDSAGASPLWARYALHEDYHDTIGRGCAAAGRAIEGLYGAAEEDSRWYVDTGPVCERGWAARAGLGFLGKNAMLVSRSHGNALLLAAILTRVEIEPDAPLRGGGRPPGGAEPVGLYCGRCTRCLDACPTRAFTSPGIVDARRCVSYLTIEHKGVIPRELRAGIGRRVFGCDTCLEVCPWNRFAHAGRRMLLEARAGIAELGLCDLLELTPVRFAEVFRGTGVKRLKLTGLLRNACVVAGNVAAGGGAGHALAGPVARLARHESALVRAHAVWAVGRIAGAASVGLLREAREAERDADVLGEYDAIG